MKNPNIIDLRMIPEMLAVKYNINSTAIIENEKEKQKISVRFSLLAITSFQNRPYKSIDTGEDTKKGKHYGQYWFCIKFVI